MRKRCIALLIATVMLLGLLAACGGQEPGYTEPVTLPAEIDELPDAPEETPPPQNGTEGLPADTREAILRFSQALFREVLALEEQNPVISPLSAYYALAMVALGARGETRDEFEAVLGRDPAALAGDLHAIANRLMDTAGSTELAIAGSIWTADDFNVDPEFARMMSDYFDAPAESRDFGAPETVDEINAWVAERTHGLIEELIESIGRDEVMLLINTLYFSAKWAESFNPMTEHPGNFYPQTGGAMEVPFLSTEAGSFSVALTDAYEAVMLPYDDGRLGFLLVRPLGGASVREFAAGHDFTATIAGLERQEDVQVRMPKLDFEFEVLLNDLLRALGLDLVFTDSSDLSGLSADEEDLFISSVLQKVRIQVDEEGTEAAAATVVAIERMSIALNLLELTFNTPYLYVIYDLEMGVPLFMGIVDNPAG